MTELKAAAAHVLVPQVYHYTLLLDQCIQLT